MARTSKKAKALTVAAVAEVADVDVRSIGEEVETVASAATSPETTAAVAASGETAFIPLNKLKKHPKNARKTPHSEASIEGKAASIAAKGMLQNIVVQPERDAEGQANVATLRFERRGEIDALSRKLARQAGAIAAFHVRYRINESARESGS